MAFQAYICYEPMIPVQPFWKFFWEFFWKSFWKLFLESFWKSFLVVEHNITSFPSFLPYDFYIDVEKLGVVGGGAFVTSGPFLTLNFEFDQ